MRPVAAQVGEDGLILLQAQVGADDFHRQHFAVAQGRLRPALAQAGGGQLLEVLGHGVIHLAKG